MKFAKVLSRIINSKKTILAVVPIAASIGSTYFGVDPTDGLMAIVNGFFGALLIAQGFLDFKWGSPSDGPL